MDDDVILRLTRDEAIVLYAWIARANAASTLVFEDQAEQRALWNLEAVFESTLSEPLSRDYMEVLAAARSRLRDVGE